MKNPERRNHVRNGIISYILLGISVIIFITVISVEFEEKEDKTFHFSFKPRETVETLLRSLTGLGVGFGTYNVWRQRNAQSKNSGSGQTPTDNTGETALGDGEYNTNSEIGQDGGDG